MTRLDRSKVPRDLLVHHVWVPREGAARRPIVYVSERSRSIVAGALLGLCVILVVAVVVLNATFWLAFALLLVAWAVVAYASGGRTGYYEVSDDGSLGEYLGRSEPDLESMELTKP